MPRLRLNAVTPQTWLRAVTGAALLAGLVLSPKLWLSGRVFPLTPALPFLKPLPYPWDCVLYGALLLAVLVVAIAPKPRMPLIAFGVVMAAMAVADQTRWQPWVYQYTFMLLAFSGRDAETPLEMGRLIVGFTYFWSGLQKLNPSFATGTFDWLLEPFAPHIPPAIQRALHVGGYAAPFVEAAIGVALLTGKLRRPAIWLAVAMHVYVLICLGPLGHNSNNVVWPWNLAMIAFLWILFRHPGPVWGLHSAYAVAIVLLFGIAPALSFFNLWDTYLSVSLYSSNLNHGVIYLTDDVAERLPDALSDDVFEEGPLWNSLSIHDWAFDELNVPPYPEARIYRNAARTICGYAENPKDVQLEIDGKWVLGNWTGHHVFHCRDVN